MELVERLAKTYTGVVHDVMRARACATSPCRPRSGPCLADRVLAGVVATVSGKVDPTADPHATLLGWTGLLSKARRRHRPDLPAERFHGRPYGRAVGRDLKRKGVRGYVADGGCRDT